MRLSDDDLRAALRAEAAGHRPDREAMLDRIATAATTGPATHRRAAGKGTRVRMASAAAAVVTLFAGGGVANWALAGSNDAAPPPPGPLVPSPSVAASPPATAPSRPAAAASARPSRSPAERPTTPAPTTKPPTTAPTATTPARGARVEQGPLRSDGSVVGDASVVTLRTTEELTALEVVIRVARTDGLVARGATKRAPGGSVSTSVTEEADAFRYRFVLSPADTLAPGEYTFTAKYAYPAGARDAGGDTYEAVAATAGAAGLRVGGDFHPR